MTLSLAEGQVTALTTASKKALEALYVKMQWTPRGPLARRLFHKMMQPYLVLHVETPDQKMYFHLMPTNQDQVNVWVTMDDEPPQPTRFLMTKHFAARFFQYYKVPEGRLWPDEMSNLMYTVLGGIPPDGPEGKFKVSCMTEDGNLMGQIAGTRENGMVVLITWIGERSINLDDQQRLEKEYENEREDHLHG